MAVDARGNPHVAFGYGTVRYASASGGGWSDPVTVQASAAYLPILTASPGALHLAYVDTSGGNSEVYYRTRPLEEDRGLVVLLIVDSRRTTPCGPWP